MKHGRPLVALTANLMESSALPPEAQTPRLTLVRPDGHSASPTGGDATVPPLLPRIAAGDERAVRECVSRYGSLVWALARRWSADGADAEDAAQEVFVDLWRTAARFDATKATEVTWVAMVTRRRLIDRARRRQRMVEVETLPDDLDVADDRAPDLDRQSQVDAAHAVLQSLPDAQRTMLELSLLHGRTHEEIARETGTPLGTVKSHIRRGLQRARALLQSSATPSRSERKDTEDRS